MNNLIIFIYLAVLASNIHISVSTDAATETFSKNGQLSVIGANLVNQDGEIIQLKGMSLFWSIWESQYWNQETIDGVHDSCHSNVVRAAMAVDTADGGYLTDPEGQLALVETVIEAAIEDDIYVIVDWHDGEADAHLTESVDFFDKISQKYGSYPNIIYEIFSEPTNQSWADDLKPYHEAVIEAIRANDPDNIIIVGTGEWCTRVDAAAADPITDQENILYSLHFYAGTHKQWLRDRAQAAITKGLPIFITEYRTDDTEEVPTVDEEESQIWWEWLDKNSLSYVNWAVSDVSDASAALIAGTPTSEVCKDDYLTLSGQLVVAQNTK